MSDKPMSDWTPARAEVLRAWTDTFCELPCKFGLRHHDDTLIDEHDPVCPRQAAAAALAEISRLQEENKALRAENICDICIDGQPLPSGVPCACCGTGLMSRAAYYMREQYVKAESKLIAERARAEAAERVQDGLRAERDRYERLWRLEADRAQAAESDAFSARYDLYLAKLISRADVEAIAVKVFEAAIENGKRADLGFLLGGWRDELRRAFHGSAEPPTIEPVK